MVRFTQGGKNGLNLGLEGKVALVSAASQGLGRAVAKELAQEGAKVAIFSRDSQQIQQTAEEIALQTNGEVAAWQGDVSRINDIRRVVHDVAARWGHIHILVCNSGGPPSGPFTSFDDAAWQWAFENNLLSVVRLVREVLPYMTEGGRILAIASSSVKQPIPGLVLSNTMRAGVAGLMKTLAEELAPHGILVNTVCPGRIATNRLKELDRARAELEETSVEEIRKSIMAKIPIGRYGEPEEFARVVTFLASEANTYITGTTLLIDGGMVKAL